MRIVAGRFRGRRIAVPSGAAARPTSARAREALFDILIHNPAFADAPIAGATVVDAFAGSGALGLEALSRGARFVHFIDIDPAALAVVRENLSTLDAAARTALHRRDAADPGPAPEAAAFAFLDPPYGAGLAGRALGALAAAGWLAPDAVATVEHGAGEALAPPDGFRTVLRRRYGRGVIDLLRRAGR